MASTHRLNFFAYIGGLALAVLALVRDVLFAPVADALGWLFSPIVLWNPDAATRIAADGAIRSVRSETLKLTPLGERFKAFIRRRMAHAENVGDGYLPEAVIVGTA